MEKTTQKPKWHINIQQNTSNIIIAENIPSLELAVKIALNFHECSNTIHSIYVMKEDFIELVLHRNEDQPNV